MQASLILALGAQNLFVLESGLKQRKQYYVAFICSLCDAILIAIGVAGAASVFVKIPSLKIVFGFLGVAFLLYYGINKIIEAIKPPKNSAVEQNQVFDLKKITLMTLSFSLLNPHVYLDTLILVGGYSAKFAFLYDRFIFGTGAAAFSAIWFFSLAAFASALNKFLKSSRAMRLVALVSGIVLIALSCKLGFDLYAWLI